VDRRFALDGSCTSPVFSVAPFRIQGVIGSDKKVLVFADTEPTIEKLTIDGNLVGERICIAMATDIKAKK